MQNADAKTYADDIINSFGRNEVPNSISDIKSMLAKAFLAGIKWQAIKSPWIKIKEGCNLPKDGVYILVRRHYRDKYGQLATRVTQEMYFVDYGFRSLCNKHLNERITHWMPIPRI